MPPSNIVTAADYADAMLVARRAKNWLFLLLLLILLLQIGLFFMARSTHWVIADPARPEPSLAEQSTSTPPATRPSAQELTRQKLVREVIQYITAGTVFLGFVCIVLLAADLMLIVNIMLVGRLVGVAQVTSAWIWCLVLALLLFPWQSFLQTPDFQGEFKIPGVLYTWSELIHPTLGAKFGLPDGMFKSEATILRLVRFVAFPVLTVVLLFIVQVKSSRGLRAALGETEYEQMDQIQPQ